MKVRTVVEQTQLNGKKFFPPSIFPFRGSNFFLVLPSGFKFSKNKIINLRTLENGTFISKVG